MPEQMLKIQRSRSLLAKGRMYSVNTGDSKLKTGTERPSSEIDQEPTYDRVDHFPSTTDKGRSRFCQKGQTRVKCLKCKQDFALLRRKTASTSFTSKPKCYLVQKLLLPVLVQSLSFFYAFL